MNPDQARPAADRPALDRPALDRPAESLSRHLWTLGEPVYAAILDHPFLVGLRRGTLPPASFAFYLIQDGHYIATFARCFSLLAARAPDPGASRLLRSHAAGSIADEQALHDGLLHDLAVSGVEIPSPPASPATYAYGNHLIRTAAVGSFAEGVASLLPCCWMYGEVGKVLGRAGSPHAVYERWLEHYGSSDYGRAVVEVLDLCDRAGAASGPDGLAACEESFLASARYEWMLWDDAFHRRLWPI